MGAKQSKARRNTLTNAKGSSSGGPPTSAIKSSDSSQTIAKTTTSTTTDRKKSISILPPVENERLQSWKSEEELSFEESYNDPEEVPDGFIGSLNFDSEPHHTGKSSAPAVKCLSGDQLLSEQQRQFKEVAEVLDIDESTAGLLLKRHKWDPDRVMTAYLEDPIKALKEVGVTKVGGASESMVKDIVLEGVEMCSICADDAGPDNSTALHCMHRFCNDCWGEYLRTHIEEGNVANLTCPGHKCTSPVGEMVIRKLVSPELFEKYARYQANSFVDGNPNVAWCPRPGCGNAVNVLDAVRGEIPCKCGYRFCFSCKQEAHLPCSCELVLEWQKKCEDDSETVNWISSFTKDCPKCKNAIEKNGGCNHMTCRYCKYEWCWVCMQEWKGHADYYSCNRYEKKKKKEAKKQAKSKKAKAEKEKADSAAQLEKYLHYYQRHINHDQSRKFEGEIREEAKKKMEQLQQADATSTEVQFIKDATEQLLECRSVLKYTYVFAYYLDDGTPEKNLFEYLQEDLEKTTEKLSELLERTNAIELASNIRTHRVEFVNLTNLAGRRLANLLDAVEQGLTQ